MIKQGSIIRALIPDPRGKNAKLRPLVVITSSHEISSEGSFVAVAITGAFSDPLADDEVRLPFHPLGQSATRLRKASVAKCSWQTKLRVADVMEVKGFVPTNVLIQILEKVGEQDETPE